MNDDYIPQGRFVDTRLPGVKVSGNPTVNATGVTADSAVIEVSEGDYFTLNAYSNSGGVTRSIIVNTATWFAVEVVESTANNTGLNLIINGNAEINQENNTNPADDEYTIGDLYNYLGEAAATVTRATTGNPVGSRFHWNVRVDSANSQAGLVYFLGNADIQSALADGKVSFSFKAKTTSGKEISNLRVAVLSWTGTADAVTSDVVATWGSGGTNPTFATNWTLENTPTNLALTTSFKEFTVENVAIDTSGANNLAVFIWTDDGTIAANDEFQVAQWMLNTGSVVSSFNQPDVATIQNQVAYYFERFGGNVANERIGAGHFQLNNRADYILSYRNKRTNPTITFSGGTGFRAANSGISIGSTSMATNADSLNGTEVRLTPSGTPFPVGQGTILTAQSTSDWINVDARF